MTRKAIGKGLRFDIFRRDGFTCRYCGAQPPDVVLHIDHILPVVEGGTNDETNLITACAPCNIGKGKKLLEIPPSPDAEMAWLETQQEIAEMRRYQESLALKRQVLNEIVEQLQGVFAECVDDDWAPEANMILSAVDRYEIEYVEEALVGLAHKIKGGYISQYGQGWQRYFWGTLKTMARERGA